MKEKFGVEFTVAGMHKWLHRHQFMFKKFKGTAHKAAVESQKEFIEKYEALKTEEGDKERIFFIDSVHPTQATKLSYGWIRRGKDKAIGTTASRTRLNMVGALQLSDIANTITKQYETINGESIVDFLHIIRERFQDKKQIHVILDQAGYHKSVEVAKMAKKLNIELHFLPPYSPNLNPIERLWKVLNQ